MVARSETETTAEVLVNAVTGKVEYWEELYRLPDKSGVEALWLSQSDAAQQIHKTGVVAQRIKVGMHFEEL